MKKSRKTLSLILTLAISMSLFVCAFAVTGEAAGPGVSYYGHVQNIGDMPVVSNGALCGTQGRSLRLEVLHVRLDGVQGGITVQAHVENYGWMNASSASAGSWVSGGIGGQSLRLEAIKLTLTGIAATQYTLMYRVHVEGIGTMNWVSDGQVAGTTGESRRIESVEIKLVPKASASCDGYVSTGSMNLVLRAAPSASSAKLASMPKGARVTVLDSKAQTNGFYHVTYNGVSGYASASYIAFSSPAAAPSGTSENLSTALYKNSNARITCKFDGYTTTKGRHEGIDISLSNGSPVYALTDGVITRVVFGSRGTNGLSTIAVYNEATGKTVIYLHSAPLSNLREGIAVSRGQQIATQDWRGVSSSDSGHTHVEVRNGRVTNAAYSLNDYVLENSDPTSFWNAMGYNVK